MVVVDASFVVSYLVQELYSAHARGVLTTLANERLIAPVLLHWEVANAIARKVDRGQLEEKLAIRAFATLDALAVELRPPPSTPDELMFLALADGLSAYDAAYLQLALQHQSALATHDQDLAKAGLRNGLFVHSPFA